MLTGGPAGNTSDSPGRSPEIPGRLSGPPTDIVSKRNRLASRTNNDSQDGDSAGTDGSDGTTKTNAVRKHFDNCGGAQHCQAEQIPPLDEEHIVFS